MQLDSRIGKDLEWIRNELHISFLYGLAKFDKTFLVAKTMDGRNMKMAKL